MIIRTAHFTALALLAVPVALVAQTAPPPPAPATAPAPAETPAASPAATATPAQSNTSALDAALKATKPLLESEGATGHVSAVTTTGCSITVTLDNETSAMIDLANAKGSSNDQTLTIAGAKDQYDFTFRGDDADVDAKAAAKALAPVTDACKK